MGRGRQRYLDCLSAYSAVNQGHCHPKIYQALVDQARTLTLTSRAFHNDQLALFYKELCELTRSHKVLPMNSGAEAERDQDGPVGLRGERRAGGQAEIIVCRTSTAGPSPSSASAPIRPPAAALVRLRLDKAIPFGDADALQAAITPDTVGFLVEPIQGEAGVIIPPDGYLRAVREICSRENVMLILDEIQTGLGRTGKLLAEEHEGIEADLTLIGKALSGGFYPVSAVLSNSEVLGVLKPGEHGSTFGGNPLACRVSRAALRVLVEEGDRERGAHGAPSRPAQIDPQQHDQGRARTRADDRRRIPQGGGRRQALLPGAQGGWTAVQGHARKHHPLHAAAVITQAQVDWALERIDKVFTATKPNHRDARSAVKLPLLAASLPPYLRLVERVTFHQRGQRLLRRTRIVSRH